MKDIAVNLKNFENIDSSEQHETFLNMLEIFNNIKEIQELKSIAREIIPYNSTKILDAACGPGIETILIAENNSHSECIGVDLSTEFLNAAIKRSNEKDLRNISFSNMNIEKLAFNDNTFDYTRAERVLLYVNNPETAIKELIRVTKKGSKICLIEPDWETYTINSKNRNITRKIFHHDCDNNIRNGWIGREIPVILKGLGISYQTHSRVVNMPMELSLPFYSGMAISTHNDNAISKQELDRYLAEINSLYNSQNLFGTVSYFLYILNI